MKLNDEQMEIIEKADKITGCYSSTIEETHWLNEEEAYRLIESFVENSLNDKINELNKKLDAQDKIINNQALEIARLKEQINIYENPDDLTLMFMWCDEKAKDMNITSSEIKPSTYTRFKE